MAQLVLCGAGTGDVGFIATVKSARGGLDKYFATLTRRLVNAYDWALGAPV